MFTLLLIISMLFGLALGSMIDYWINEKEERNFIDDNNV